MKFLHTADIHLKKDVRERIEVLRWLVNKAQQLSCDYIIVAGDLFDSNADAAVLRSQVKEIFDRAACPIIIIPGNHDSQAFGPEHDYGTRVIQLATTPYTAIDCKGITICGIPFQEVPFSELAKSIPRETGILIAHGTLYDQSFIFTMLDDEETAYMPIYPAHLENTARYVALGHLHSRFIHKKYKNTQVVYPGSPLALDTKCTGERRCALLSLDEKHVKVEPVSIEIAPYWRTEEVFVFPAIENDIPQRITRLLEDVPDNMMPNLVIRGFIGSAESDFKKSITEAIQDHATRFSGLKVDLKVSSWNAIIQNPLVRRFVEKTMALDEQLRMKVYEVAFPVFCELLK